MSSSDFQSEVKEHFAKLTFKKATPASDTKAKTGKLEYKLTGASSNFGPKNRGIVTKEGKVVHQLHPEQKVDWANVKDTNGQPKFTEDQIRQLTKSENADYFIYDMVHRVAGWKNDVVSYINRMGSQTSESVWITGANFKDKNARVTVTQYWDQNGQRQFRSQGVQISPVDLIAWEKAKITEASKVAKMDEKTRPLPLGLLPSILSKVQKITPDMMSNAITASADVNAPNTFVDAKKKTEIPDVKFIRREPRLGGAHAVSLPDRLRKLIMENRQRQDIQGKQFLNISGVNAAGGGAKLLAYTALDTDPSEKKTRKSHIRLVTYVPQNKRGETDFEYLAFNASYDAVTGKFTYADGLRNAIRILGITGVTADEILGKLPRNRSVRRAKSPASAPKAAPAPIASMNMNIPLTGAAQRPLF